MQKPLSYGQDMSREQIDDALMKLTQLMAQEDLRERNTFDNEDDILNSIKELASQVSSLEFRQTLPQPKPAHNKQYEMQQIVSRIYDRHQHTKDKIEQMRQEQLKIDTHKPTISEQSRKIIQKKMQNGEYQPIHHRAEQIWQGRKQKNEEAAKRKEKEEEFNQESQLTFRPNLGPNHEPRSVSQFLQEVDYFVKKKNEYIQYEQQSQLLKELDNVTFKPQINPNSERIVSQSKELNMSVQERLLRSRVMRQFKEKRRLEDEIKNLPFKPTLNNNSVKMVKKSVNESMQIPTHERLHKAQPSSRKIRPSQSRTPTRPKSAMNQSLDTSQNYRFLDDSIILAVNQNINNLNNSYIGQNTKSQVQTIKKSSPRKYSPPQKNQTKVNEIQYLPHMKFIVDLVKKKK